MAYGKCFLSGEYGQLERHHIFGGPLRSKSEKYGLVVELTPWMHREGPVAAHRCGATAQKLKAYGQRKVMIDQGWDLDRFIAEFGRNWLSDEELEEVAEAQGIRQAPAKEPVIYRGLVKADGGQNFRVTLELLPF